MGDMRGNQRLFAILHAVGSSRRSTLKEVAERVELPKPTVLRFLRSLEDGAWVTRRSDGEYSLGPSILGLAGQYLRCVRVDEPGLLGFTLGFVNIGVGGGVDDDIGAQLADRRSQGFRLTEVATQTGAALAAYRDLSSTTCSV